MGFLNFLFNRNTEAPIEEVSVTDKMSEASFPIIAVKFNGVLVNCKVRSLTQVQIQSIGDFGVVDISTVKSGGKGPTLDEVSEMRSLQVALVKETLVSPTFKEIEEKVYGQDIVLTERMEKIKTLRARLDDVDQKDRKEFEAQLHGLELYAANYLPVDFLDEVTSWAMGTTRTDIKKVTREMLLRAAFLAVNGKDNPADHLQGEFLAQHTDELNQKAWIVYKEYLDDKELEKKGVQKVVGGPVG